MLNDQDLAQAFPALTPGLFSQTSAPSNDYNCIAWAARDDLNWWEPLDGAGYFWPRGLPWAYDPEILVAVYCKFGYQDCQGNATLEAGFEKVAVFRSGAEYTHAARQLPNGHWTSKLGIHQDIEHHTLDAIAGGDYGDLFAILKRKLL